MGFDLVTRSWRIRVGYRAGSEEVVDGRDGRFICIRSIYVFHMLTLAVAVARMSRNPYALYSNSCAIQS